MFIQIKKTFLVLSKIQKGLQSVSCCLETSRAIHFIMHIQSNANVQVLGLCSFCGARMLVYLCVCVSLKRIAFKRSCLHPSSVLKDSIYQMVCDSEDELKEFREICWINTHTQHTTHTHTQPHHTHNHTHSQPPTLTQPHTHTVD